MLDRLVARLMAMGLCEGRLTGLMGEKDQAAGALLGGRLLGWLMFLWAARLM